MLTASKWEVDDAAAVRPKRNPVFTQHTGGKVETLQVLSLLHEQEFEIMDSSLFKQWVGLLQLQFPLLRRWTEASDSNSWHSFSGSVAMSNKPSCVCFQKQDN